MLEADAQAKQVRRNSLAFPPAAALDQRLDAAEAGRIRDYTDGALDRLRVAGDVEGEQAAETRVADPLDCWVRGQSFGDRLRVRGVSLHPYRERLQAPEQEPGRVRRGHDPGAPAELSSTLRLGGIPGDDGAEQHVRVAAEELG